MAQPVTLLSCITEVTDSISPGKTGILTDVCVVIPRQMPDEYLKFGDKPFFPNPFLLTIH
jgi:hypothetical protein